MSISGINSSMASSVYSGVSSQKASSSDTTKMTKEQMEDIVKNSEFYSSRQNAIQEDLKKAVEELMADSDGEKPDPETMRKTVNRIFSEHGLDAEAIMNKRFGSVDLLFGGSSSTNGAESYPKTLFDYLENNEERDGSSLLSQYAEQMSQHITDLLAGIDEVA